MGMGENPEHSRRRSSKRPRMRDERSAGVWRLSERISGAYLQPPVTGPPCFPSLKPVKNFGCLFALSSPRRPTTPLASQLTATARWKTPTCALSPIASKSKPGARAFHLNAKTPRPPQSSRRARCPQPEVMQSPAGVAVLVSRLSTLVCPSGLKWKHTGSRAPLHPEI